MQHYTHTASTSLPPQVIDGVLAKMQGLPARYVPEVEHFIEFLKQRDDQSGDLVEGYLQLSAEAWDDE